MIARLDTRIDEATLPFVAHTEPLATIPGIAERAAQAVISEIGVDMDSRMDLTRMRTVGTETTSAG